MKIAAVALGLVASLVGAPAMATDFGATVSPPSKTTMTDFENTVGRPMERTRLFFRWDSAFPSDYALQMKGTHTLMVSVQAMRSNGTRLSWADIAAAPVGSVLRTDMVRWARGLRDLAVPVFFTFNHEPEVERNATSGTAADYIAAWRAFDTVLRNQGATNVSRLWIMTADAFRQAPTDRRYAAKWYPGDAYVDGIASDAYNWGPCRAGVNSPWRSLEYLVEGQRQFGLAHPGIPLYLAEWASTEHPTDPTLKPQWIRDARTYLKSHPEFVAVSYYAVPGVDDCVWTPESSPAALQAFREMAADPYFGGTA